MTSTASRVLSGAVVQTTQGVLRGVGPMGPRGFTGNQGPAGPQGPPGEQPELDPITARFIRTTTEAPVITNVWDPVALETVSWSVGEMASLAGDGSIVLAGAHPDGVSALLTLSLTVVPGSGLSESFTIEAGLFAGTATVPFAARTFRHVNGATASTFGLTGQLLVTSGTAVTVKLRVSGATVSPLVSGVELVATRGGGPKGPVGPQGPTGTTGATGPQGVAGNSGSGYATMDALDSTGDSDADPGGSTLNSQSLPYPTGNMSPRLPFFLRNLAASVAARLVRRFASYADMTNATDTAPGQIAYVTATQGMYASWTNPGGQTSYQLVAQVIYGTSATPPGGAVPNGTIYLQVT